MDPGVQCHGMKANPTGYLWSKYEYFLMSGCQDIDFLKTLTKWNGNGNGNENRNGNVYDRGDYNSSFALRAVELKKTHISCTSEKVYQHLCFLLPRNRMVSFIA